MSFPPKSGGGGGGGAAINTLPAAPAVSASATDTIAGVINGVPSQITMDKLVEGLGVAPSALPDAAALAGDQYIPVMQAGVECKVSLSALQTFLGVQAGPAVPSAVGSLAAGAVGQTTVGLTWTNASNSPTGWNVKQRLAGSGSYTNSSMSVAASATGGTVSGLTAGTAYDFQVFASNGGGTGPAATLLAVTTAAAGGSVPPAGVTSLTGTSSDDRVALTWVNEPTGTGWRVEQSPTGANTWTTSTLLAAASATGATVIGLAGATGYDFRVTVFNGSGDGPATTLTNKVTLATMTVTGFSGNAVKTAITVSASTAGTYSSAQGALRGLLPDKTCTTQYWSSTGTPASMSMGWGTSSTVPPAVITDAQNVAGSSSINGMSPVAKPGQFADDNYFWVSSTPGTYQGYLWALPVGGHPQCMNPATPLTVTMTA